VPRRSGQQRLLEHLLDHVDEWCSNQTLRNASGLDDVTRVIRMLGQAGWRIERRQDGFSRLTSAIQGEARGHRNSISGKLRYLVLHKCHYRCRACGKGVDEDVKLVIDHILPVDWGGLSGASNLQALCEECNQGKQADVNGIFEEHS